MASRKTKRTKTTTSEGQKKALVCMVHSQSSAGRSFVYFSGCQRPENRLEKFRDTCKRRRMKPADSPNRIEDSFNQVPEKIETKTRLPFRLLAALNQKS